MSSTPEPFDLLTTVEYGGCSAKLSPLQLAEALHDLGHSTHPDLLVAIDTHDDAGVYRINDTTALVQTTDFFTPICSDPFEFGQIAAANALSDVYAMGGTPLTALNLVMFPQNKIPLGVLRDILAGGQSKVREAGALIVGGHTIDDYPPKYGLAVTGTVHPRKFTSNNRAQPGMHLVLTKPLGSGVLVAGQRIGEADPQLYRGAIENMKKLNKTAAGVMQQFDIECATDITGFGLLGHALKMAQASGVSIRINARSVPLLAGSYDLIELGCIPGAAFRNQQFVEPHTHFSSQLDYNLKMSLLDAQTSGGLLIAIRADQCSDLVAQLTNAGVANCACIGTVEQQQRHALSVYQEHSH
jgi:selenide,water dikinase